jgi:lipoprotein-anchoring transpeptidase ErfK/SrfK
MKIVITVTAGLVAMLSVAAVCATPAAAHPYDQYIRGRSFLGALFGPNIASGVVSYPIAVGAAGYAWSGINQVTAKREWPDWTPPGEMLQRRPDLPRHMAGGPDNPMGARAIYLGSSLYRIHGSNDPDKIGQAVSSGCIRMTNQDVIDLYNRVQIGATVIVQ